MKKKKVIKTSEIKKTKAKWETMLINAFAIVLLGGAFVWMSIIIYHESTSEKESRDQYLSSLPNLTDTIPHNKICMVDNIFQGDFPSIPITISNRTYYGCSQKATRDLTSVDSLRIATDPISKTKVDKAVAIIAIHPEKNGKVIYFGSKDTYTRYLTSLNKPK